MILIAISIVAFILLGGIKTSKAVGRSAEEFGYFLNVKSGSMTDNAIYESILEESQLRGEIVAETGCSDEQLDAEFAKKRKRYGLKR